MKLFHKKKKSRLFNYPRTFNDKEEFLKFLGSFRSDESHYLLILLLQGCVTGARISDIVSLKVTNFRNNYSEVYIYENKIKRPRRCPIPAPMRTIIAEYISRNSDSILREGYIFAYRGLNYYRHKNKHIQPSTVRWKIKEKLEELKIDHIFYHDEQTGRKHSRIGTHTFRRWFINQVYENTKDIVKTQKLISHISMRTTYQYIQPPNNQETNKIVNSVFENQFLGLVPNIPSEQKVLDEY